jgi:hypothetical protein
MCECGELHECLTALQLIKRQVVQEWAREFLARLKRESAAGQPVHATAVASGAAPRRKSKGLSASKCRLAGADCAPLAGS